jgi:hypothetical protein
MIAAAKRAASRRMIIARIDDSPEVARSSQLW